MATPWQSQGQRGQTPRFPLFCDMMGWRNLMISLLWILALLGTDLVKTPSVVPSDSGAVIASAKGGGRWWAANWTMEPFERNGKKAIRFTERGEGHVSPSSGQLRWT